MKRRLLTILLPLAFATLGAGCTTFTDNDVSVRVDDAELSGTQLEELGTFIASASGSRVTATDGEQARNAATIWLQNEVVGQYLKDQGIEIPEEVRAQTAADIDNLISTLTEGTTFDGLSDDVRDITIDIVVNQSVYGSTGATLEDIERAIVDADVYVDPRLGTYIADLGVVALG